MFPSLRRWSFQAVVPKMARSCTRCRHTGENLLPVVASTVPCSSHSGTQHVSLARENVPAWRQALQTCCGVTERHQSLQPCLVSQQDAQIIDPHWMPLVSPAGCRITAWQSRLVRDPFLRSFSCAEITHIFKKIMLSTTVMMNQKEH